MTLELPERFPLQLWGGVECTVNRIGDRFYDQLERSGHVARLGDLDLFAELGIRGLRYPVLWERTAPDGLSTADWSWADERLARLRELGIRPIVGLVHHGSGPRTTNLLDPAFPEKLAEFASAVANRYPWVDAYTPVNEPLTTARFSGLYGTWYPHCRDDASFTRALVNECRGVALSMEAIRAVNPAAQLIQTEDLGKTYSTPKMAYQAEFENNRRWLTFDLLCGRLDRAHPLWDYMVWAQIGVEELEWFLHHPCPPNILGANYYLTSERFLDEHVERYPSDRHGGNRYQPYADVTAVRVRAEGIAGFYGLLREMWERYQLPVAITEVHNGCTREEQLRWFVEAWEAGQTLRREGVDLRAITAWSLLGAFNWNSLLTRDDDFYEPGVFDLRAARPRPTALARLLAELTAGAVPSHPVLDVPGWWRRQERLLFEPVQSAQEAPAQPEHSTMPRTALSPRPLLIVGANGTLGTAFSRLCSLRGLAHQALRRQDVDIADQSSVEAALHQLRPWAVVNAAGYVRVDDAECESERCYRENVIGPITLARACAARGIQFVTFSSDLVFNGQQTVPYVEGDTVAPLNVYGRSKAEAERKVLEALSEALIIRTSAFFGPWDQYNFVTIALSVLARGEPFIAAEDAIVSPTYVPDLVHATLDLLIDGATGIWHLANAGSSSWADLARHVARQAGYQHTRVLGYPTKALELAAVRPLYSVLGSQRGLLLPSLDNALDRYFWERRNGNTDCPL